MSSESYCGYSMEEIRSGEAEYGDAHAYDDEADELDELEFMLRVEYENYEHIWNAELIAEWTAGLGVEPMIEWFSEQIAKRRAKWRAEWTAKWTEAKKTRLGVLQNAELIDNNEKKIDSAQLKEGAKIIAGIENNKQIKNKLIHKLMLEDTDYAISRYFRKESLPTNYFDIVKSPNCIEVLIKGILYKICKIKHTDALNFQIVNLCKTLRKNDGYLIAYDRVGIIQKFVHSAVDLVYGEGFHETLPAKHMRHLLSASRLHINLSDLYEKDEAYAIYIDQLSRLASDFESINPKTPVLSAGKHYDPKWRIRHLKSLSHFYTQHNRRKIFELNALDEHLSIEKYKLAALEVYALY